MFSPRPVTTSYVTLSTSPPFSRLRSPHQCSVSSGLWVLPALRWPLLMLKSLPAWVGLPL